MSKTAIAVLLSCSVVLADERPFEDWLDEKIGTIACERADEIVGMLAALEQEHRVVLEKHALVEDASDDVSSNAGLTQFAQRVAKAIGSTYDDVRAEYARFDYTSQVQGDISAGTVLLRLNAEMKQEPWAAKAQICRMLAGQAVNRNMVGRGKPKAWHRNLDDVNAICLGCGKILLDSIRVERKSVGDRIQSSFSRGTSLTPVEVGWTLHAIGALRGEDRAVSPTATVQRIALERGRVALAANVDRVRALMKAFQAAIDSGKDASIPADAPAWAEGEPVLVPKVAKPKGPSVLEYWTPVPTAEEIREQRTDASQRFLKLRKSVAGALEKGDYAQATTAFSDACLSDGPDFALAAVGDAATKANLRTEKKDKEGISRARWLSRVMEVTEARDYLRANEEVLSGRKAHFYHHLEAAQRQIVLGDTKRAYDEVAKADVQSAHVIDIMRGKVKETKSTRSDILVPESLGLIDRKPPRLETEVAEYWWDFAKGKRKKVMDFARRLSAEWYGRVVARSDIRPKKVFKRVKGKLTEVEEDTPEWYRIARQRAAMFGHENDLRREIKGLTFAKEAKTVGSSGISLPVFVGSKESPPSRLSSRTVVWRNKKGVKTREEVFFQPRDFWEHGELAGAWMDERGNELRVFQVRNLPLRDEEFDETVENGPTKDHLTERIAASAMRTADADDLLQWASRFYGEAFEKSALSKVPCGKMAVAFAFSRDGLSSGGVFLKTYRKEWFFADMRLTGEIADLDALLRKLALGAKTMSWNQTGGTPVIKEDGAFVYTMPGYVVKVEMPQNLASSFMARIKPMLEASMSAHRRYLPPEREMKPSVLRVFNDRARYDSHVNAATEQLENNSVGMWMPSREELVVMSGMKQVKDTIAAETFGTLRHEAFHQYLFYATGRGGHAMWFNEGHACFFETGAYSASARRLSPNDDPGQRRPKDLAKDVLGIAKLIPQILPLSHDGFYAGPLTEVNRRYAAAWAVTYFLEKAIWVMNGMDAYKDVLPTYLKLMEDGKVSAKDATEKAWAPVSGRDVAADFMRFWNDPKARKAARAYEPATQGKVK